MHIIKCFSANRQLHIQVALSVCLLKIKKNNIPAIGYFILVYLAAMEGEDITEKYISGAHTEVKPENTEHFQDPLIEHNVDINSTMSSTSISSRLWKIFGKTIPKNEVIFICQVVILYIVIITCIVNLSLGNGDSNLWTALLSSSMGIMLPAPTLSRRRS